MITDALINGASNVLQWLAGLLPTVSAPAFPTATNGWLDLANLFFPISELMAFAVWLAAAGTALAGVWLVWRIWFAIKW